MPAGDRRGIGKNDDLDAARIARAVLGCRIGRAAHARGSCRPTGLGSRCGSWSWPANR